MSGLKNGPITQNELMQRLANAKKVMNKVESGDYATGNINESDIVSDDATDYEVADRMLVENDPIIPTAPVNSGTSNIDRINNSKLPEVIKKAMIENPIAQVSLNDTLNMDFVKKTKQIMESEGVSLKPPTRSPQRPQQKQVSSSVNINEIAVALTPIIENIIRKVLDEKLNQILTAQSTQTINENLVLKVGDTIFKGKITGAKSAK